MFPARIFDSHFHIIDPAFPLIENNGYLPPAFTTGDYLEASAKYNITGGAIVSGSFQGFDQAYLIRALQLLGNRFVGVTQLPANSSDEEILELHKQGVRAVRFNLKRGGSEGVEQLEFLAKRVFELADWHIELYVDSKDLEELSSVLTRLPLVSIDHLGLSQEGLKNLLTLVEGGVYVKATGFGRVELDVPSALRAIVDINPKALMFGTDLPSTRARRPFSSEDIDLIVDTVGPKLLDQVFYQNAYDLYFRRRLD